MKRVIASLASVVMLLTIAAPAFASPNLRTRNSQPRPSRRLVKLATLASYSNRHNIAYRRLRYNMLVQRLMPSFLAVTGGAGRTHSDLMIISRPGRRAIKTWTLANHCVRRSRRCGN